MTDWGLHGPRSTDPGGIPLVSLAASGAMLTAGPLDRPPCNAPGPLAYDCAAIYGALGAMIALHDREGTGGGRFVEVSVEEAALSALYPWSIPTYSYSGTIGMRGGGYLTTYPAKDGYVRMIFSSDRHWDGMLDILGHPAPLGADEWKQRDFRRDHIDVVNGLIAQETRRFTVDQLLEGGHRFHIPCASLRAPSEVVSDPNLVARQFFQEVEVLGAKRLVPSLPFTLSPSRTPPTGLAPQLGATNRTVLRPAADPKRLPFEGLRVVSCCIGAVGPESSRILGEYGADVIKIESAQFPETMRLATTMASTPENPLPPLEVGAGFNDANRGKRSVAIDLRQQEGRDLLRRLVCAADVVVENYRADAVRNWGIAYDQIKALNPDILYYSSEGFGKGGPDEAHSIMGPNISPSIGMTYLWGWPEEDPPVGAVLPHPDHIAGKVGTIALLAAMLHRRRTDDRSPVELNLSQAEAGILFIAEHFATLQPRGSEPARVGNSGRGYWAPHGVYPCAGDDRWCALGVRTDAQWHALCEVLGRPDLRDDPRLSTLAGRAEHEEEIDAAIAAWSIALSPDEAAAQLRRVGVPASGVRTPPEQLADAHLSAREAFVTIDRAVVGPQQHLREHGIKISGMTPRTTTPAPLLGHDTDEVCREWLTMSDQEIADLRSRDVIG